jgi:hypothetical protein
VDAASNVRLALLCLEPNDRVWEGNIVPGRASLLAQPDLKHLDQASGLFQPVRERLGLPTGIGRPASACGPPGQSFELGQPGRRQYANDAQCPLCLTEASAYGPQTYPLVTAKPSFVL